MTSLEMVTTFKLRQDFYETPMGTFDNRQDAADACICCDFLPENCITARVEMASMRELIKAVNAYCGNRLAEEYSFSAAAYLDYSSLPKNDKPIPAEYWNLIAFAVEGGSEGYYVHFGAILRAESAAPPSYVDFATAKTYSAESAYELARETSRFLAAAAWN